jgi:hypothetical protein
MAEAAQLPAAAPARRGSVLAVRVVEAAAPRRESVLLALARRVDAGAGVALDADERATPRGAAEEEERARAEQVGAGAGVAPGPADAAPAGASLADAAPAGASLADAAPAGASLADGDAGPTCAAAGRRRQTALMELEFAAHVGEALSLSFLRGCARTQAKNLIFAFAVALLSSLPIIGVRFLSLFIVSALRASENESSEAIETVICDIGGLVESSDGLNFLVDSWLCTLFVYTSGIMVRIVVCALLMLRGAPSDAQHSRAWCTGQVSSRFNKRTRKLIPYSVVGIVLTGAGAVLRWHSAQTPSTSELLLVGIVQSWCLFALGNIVYEFRRFAERRKLRRLALGITLNLAVGMFASFAGYLSCSYVVLSLQNSSGGGSIVMNGTAWIGVGLA